MTGTGAIAVVVRSTNGDRAAISRKGHASSGEITSGFSIDVSADLLPGFGCSIAPIDAHMAGSAAVAIVAIGTNSDSAAVSRQGHAGSGEITSGFSIDVTAKLLPAGGN